MFMAILAGDGCAGAHGGSDPAFLLLHGGHVFNLSVNFRWNEFKQLLMYDADMAYMQFLLVRNINLL